MSLDPPSLQAQTMANFFLAFEQNLAIVPVLNKADLPSADPEGTAQQMQQARRCAVTVCPSWWARVAN